MAKTNLLLLATLLATALLATALATTTITTTVITTNDESSQSQRCQSQIRGRRFRSCQNYFTQGSRRTSSYEDDEMIAMVSDVANPEQQEQQYLKDCCERIRQVNEQCQCEAIKQAVRSAQQQQQPGGYEGQQMQQVYQKAKNLPSQCNLRIRQCDIRAIFV